MRIFKKIFFSIIIILILSLFSLIFYLKSSLPKTSGELYISGLKNKVKIVKNRRGIPEITASNTEDMFFAIGFVHAQDRLFQMELSRRLATGRLSEIFGKIALYSDIFHKKLLIEESIERDYKNVVKDEKIYVLLKSYINGINYFIKNKNLPIEFKILRFKPEKWNVKDILSILKNMEMILEDSGSELTNMNLIRIFGKDKASELIYGNYGSSIINGDEYKKIYEDKTFKALLKIEKQIREKSVGSDNWVVSGKRTDTGLPFLANDPHLSNSFPGYFYQILGKVDGTDIELSGNTIPGTPFIIIGRNKYLGWGVTNVGTDVIDYFILKINPNNKNQYFLDGKWKDFKIIEKKIKIKDEKTKTIKIKTSVFGSIVEHNGITMARHSVLLYPSSVFKSIYKINFSKNISQFLKALSFFTAPAQNFVFADVKGNIGYYPTGIIPIRAKGDGSLPIEVTKRDETWQGFLDENKKPIILNPDKGYIATANNPIIPKNKLPNFSKYNYISFRADEIKDFFEKKEVFSIEDMKRLQLNSHSKAAEFLVNSIKNFNFKNDRANFVFKKLTNWDFNMDKGIYPYLFYRFERELAKEIFSDKIKKEEDKKFISVFWIYRIMKYPKFKTGESFKNWIDDKKTKKQEIFEEIVERALVKTYDIYKKESEKTNLNWEYLHKVLYMHPLGKVKILGYFFNRGPFFMAGGRSTILRADFNPKKDFFVTHLSAFRMILNFSDFSSSLLVNSTGQSGNFLSPFYDDQIKLYVNLKYRKMENFTGKVKTLLLLPK